MIITHSKLSHSSLKKKNLFFERLFFFINSMSHRNKLNTLFIKETSNILPDLFFELPLDLMTCDHCNDQ